jgi:hypothetical protein
MVNLQSLIREPFLQREKSILLESATMLFFEHEVVFQNGSMDAVLAGSAGQRIGPAGGGAIPINLTPLGRDKRAPLALGVLHIQVNHGKIALLVQLNIRVLIQESSRFQLQLFLQP